MGKDKMRQIVAGFGIAALVAGVGLIAAGTASG